MKKVSLQRMRLFLKILFVGILAVAIYLSTSYNYRPKHLLSIIRGIDELCADSLVVVKRDYQSYNSVRGIGPNGDIGENISVHKCWWRLGNTRFYYSELDNKNEDYKQFYEQSKPYLMSVIKKVDRNGIMYIEIDEDTIFGATLYHRKGRTFFLYPKHDIDTIMIDSVLRKKYTLRSPHGLSLDDALNIKGDNSFRYVIVP